MPWIRFNENWDWRPPLKSKAVIIAFREGTTVFVTRRCATDVVTLGKGSIVSKPNPGSQGLGRGIGGRLTKGELQETRMRTSKRSLLTIKTDKK